MFDTSREYYHMDEQEMAYSSFSGRKDKPKKDLVYKFEDVCRRNDCKSIRKDINDVQVLYTLKFKDRKDFELSVNKQYYEINNYYIQRIEASYQAKHMLLNKKVNIKKAFAKILIGSGIVLAGSAAAYGLAHMEMPSNNIETEADQIQQDFQNRINHSEALERYNNDKKKEITNYNQLSDEEIILEDMREHDEGQMRK